ncbi:penicillin-binding protein 2 [Amylibacter sp.]|nr:penicillin-binding protein 2 [Amylibacter sp.]
MRRKPLRPLAHIIAARQDGKNPDFIEAKERSERNQVLQQKTRVRAENRLLALGLIFIIGFSVVGGKMAMLASSSANEVRQYNTGSKIINQRANIVDRNGNILATNMSTQALYAQPPLMINPKKAADDLLRIFPDLNQKRVVRNFTSGKRKFVWVKKSVSPEQQQQVHDLGEPGLLFGNREIRLYPNGKLAAHILGGTRFGEEGVKAAEIVGVGGVEKYFDDMLRDPALEGKPLELSIDLTAQAVTRQVLKDGMRYMNAKGASAILMDVHTGEIISLVSLPDFDPNNRPREAVSGDPSDHPLFNRAAQGLYELGSTFKIFTAATSLEKGLANPKTIIDTTPFRWNKKNYNDYRDYGLTNSVEDVIMKSSNTGTIRMALAAGSAAQKKTLKDLGFFKSLPIELVEASRSKPLIPKNWSDSSTITISYGHGISATPMHLASAYSIIANGGFKVLPTLKKQIPSNAKKEQVISTKTSEQLTSMLRRVVSESDGTATMGNVYGYQVAGKTGTADKIKPSGGYYKDKVMTTFASIFPASNPKYTLIVTLDEPEIEVLGKRQRTAGFTAVPVAAEIISRVAPILNLRPIATNDAMGYTSISSQ